MKKDNKAAEKAEPKTEKKAAEKAAKVSVEKVKPSSAKKLKATDKVVSGSVRVNFQPNGVNPKLGEKIHRISGSVAQDFVNKGWGSVVE